MREIVKFKVKNTILLYYLMYEKINCIYLLKGNRDPTSNARKQDDF